MISTNNIIGGALGTGLGYMLTKSILPSLGFGVMGAAYLPKLLESTPLDKHIQKSIPKMEGGGGSHIENEVPEGSTLSSMMNDMDPSNTWTNPTFGDTLNFVEKGIPNVSTSTMLLPESTKGIFSPTKLLPSGETIEKIFDFAKPIQRID